MRNCSLWSNVVFEEEVISLKDHGWNATESTKSNATGVNFLSVLSRKFDDQLSQNFHTFVILCICWDTPSENTCPVPLIHFHYGQLHVFSANETAHVSTLIQGESKVSWTGLVMFFKNKQMRLKSSVKHILNKHSLLPIRKSKKKHNY